MSGKTGEVWTPKLISNRGRALDWGAQFFDCD